MKRKKLTRKKVQDGRFNLFIRLRDSALYDFRFFVCISCPPALAMKPVANLQAGHFYHFSVSSALTFDEVNVNGQCDFCNLNTGTDPKIFERYKKGLIQKYGSGVIDYLDSKKKNRSDFSQVNLMALDDYYKEQIKLINSGQYRKELRQF